MRRGWCQPSSTLLFCAAIVSPSQAQAAAFPRVFVTAWPTGRDWAPRRDSTKLEQSLALLLSASGFRVLRPSSAGTEPIPMEQRTAEATSAGAPLILALRASRGRCVGILAPVLPARPDLANGPVQQDRLGDTVVKLVRHEMVRQSRAVAEHVDSAVSFCRASTGPPDQAAAYLFQGSAGPAVLLEIPSEGDTSLLLKEVAVGIQGWARAPSP